MKLILHVISYKAKTPDSPLSIIVDQKSATIGRLTDNTLVLPDSMRYLSGHHAKIEYQSPDYFLTDTSTNGVFINHSSTHLGHGNTIKLQNKDLFSIGDYEIAVQISEQSQEIPTTIFAAHIENIDSINELVKPDSVPFIDTSSDPIKQMIESNELIPDNWENNIKNNSDPFTIKVTGSSKSDLDKTHELKRAAPYLEAFQPFKEQIKLKNTEKIDTQQTAAGELSSSTKDNIFSEDWFTKDKSYKQDTASNSQANPLMPETPSCNGTPSSQQNEVSTIKTSPADDKNLSLKPSLSENQDSLIQSFLRGANLKDDRLAKSLTAETFHTIGIILRASIQGTMDVLSSRARIKSEMHLDITTIKAIQNNPIKFSVSAEEALSKLLLNQDKGYLTANDAISEAFSDISAHQLSVIAGMKTALTELLKRFDPKKLEQSLQQKSPMTAGIPIRKQAKLWDLFEQLYKEIGQETEDDFHLLFGQAFAESYNKQVNIFNAANNNMPGKQITPEL